MNPESSFVAAGLAAVLQRLMSVDDPRGFDKFSITIGTQRFFVMTAALAMIVFWGTGCATRAEKTGGQLSLQQAIELKEQDIKRIQQQTSDVKADVARAETGIRGISPKSAEQMIGSSEAIANKEYGLQEQLKDLEQIEFLLNRRLQYWRARQNALMNWGSVIDSR